MIYIGIGSNLNGKNNETPLENCKKAIKELKKQVNICKVSSWYKSEPVPKSNQSWFINGVVEISTNKSSLELLEFILNIIPHPNCVICKNHGAATCFMKKLLNFVNQIQKDLAYYMIVLKQVFL